MTPAGSGISAKSAPLDFLFRWWFLAVAVAIFAVPGIIQLGQRVWSTEEGAQGPIILTTGLWLLWRELSAAGRGRPGNAVIGGGLLLVALAGYVLGRILGMLSLEWLCTYLALVALLYAYVGGQVIRRIWFPLFYLLFLVPPPFSVVAPLTSSLRLIVSAGAVNILSALGYQAAYSGVNLYIDGYELLVAAACSGMNSLFSLLAIGLFYVFLRHRAEWGYALFLAVLVIPIAIGTNLVRVVILMLITHYFGVEAGQGLLHEAAGMIMFFIALIALMLVDAVFMPLRERLRGTAQR